MTSPLHRTRSGSFVDLVAVGVIAVAPVIGFQAIPLWSKASFLMVFPLAVLVAAYVRRPMGTLPLWEWALIAVLCLSVVWSDEPGYSAERLRTYGPLVLAVTVACSTLRPARIIRALGLGFALLLATSAFVLLTDPGSRMWKGDFVLVAQFPKNTLGGLLGLALVLTVAKPRRLNSVIVPLLVLAIAFNYCVTSWLVSTLIVVVSLGTRWAARHLRPTSVGPTMFVALVMGVGAFVLSIALGSSSALEAVGKDSTLSERTDIWSACWQEIKAAPLLGHGAFTFLDSASRSPVTLRVWAQFQGYQPPHPHNGFLDLWGQLGLVGLVVFFAMVGRALVLGGRMTLRGDPTARAGVTCLLFLLLFGATEPTYIGAWLTVVLPCTIACSRAWAFRHEAADDQPAPPRPLVPSYPAPGSPSGGLEVPAGGRGGGPDHKPPFLAAR